MKASDLIVNDWFFLDGEVQQIMPSVIDYVWNDFMPPLNIEPIPLDSDILKANGFELVERKWGGMFKFYADGLHIYIDRDENGNLELDTNTYQGDFQDCKIEYVHELQHLLRVAGLSEMADNFKIEKGGAA